MKTSLRFAAWAAFWGDTPRAAEQVLRSERIDYLVSDYLAEITMALLARARAKDPATGYVADAVRTLAAILPEIEARGIKVITNAGALNADACAEALERAAREAGVSLRVASVEGDDLMPRLDEILAADPHDMFTGESIPGAVSTMNAYLGARPIAEALAAGADIVVTGRCADAAVVLGPLMYEFGWSDDDYDRLAAGSLVGHIIECGPQATGGIHTDWWAVPGWDNLGYPIADVDPDGTAVISKPPDTGGLVSVGTVSEQVLYEIGDPGAYVMPDVVCDWREVHLEQIGPDQVRVSGARGSAPTTTYKVTATHSDSYRAMATAMFAGLDAVARAHRAGEAMVTRAGRLLEHDGFAPLAEASIEVIGDGKVLAPHAAAEVATGAVLKIGVRHPDKAALEIFAQEFAAFGLVAQGMTGVFAGRPRVAPVFRVLHLLVDKATTPVTVRIAGESRTVAVAPGVAGPPVETPTVALVLGPVPDESASSAAAGGGPAADRVEVPLRALAWARSGDKGDRANIGVIARRPEFLPVIREQLTVERVAQFFAHYSPSAVRCWELPGLNALNFLLDDVLGGTGGTSTLRYDPQGKSYAAMLLTVGIEVPRDWDWPAHPELVAVTS
ncbi:acyclic terpene utilization AtuA family protein [Conexibacter sp. DBS9H8]|uniref:acyclic terpene utilization AtuA family protein n=1 Tax=Conexibacter sp. DBS9H8 TaxID=2937801 RepID=UPI00200C6B57|nr:acyclic terpene utilization AtuA family protein [Conexibacter sp. DBS9H8]